MVCVCIQLDVVCLLWYVMDMTTVGTVVMSAIVTTLFCRMTQLDAV